MSTSIVTSYNGPCTIEQHHQSGKQSVFVKCLGDSSGTDTVRCLMKTSFTTNCEGRLYSDAILSTHFFHLRMGMLPEERKISVLTHNFGISGECTLRAFDRIHAAYRSSKITPEQKAQIKDLKIMLTYARTQKYDTAGAKQLPDEELFKAKSELLALQDKTYSYIQNEFIPQLLSVLKAAPQKPYSDIDTKCWGAIPMEMSQEGQKRWKEDLDSKTTFVPFEKFEHLHSYMTPQQRQQLDEILAPRK